MIKLIMEIGRFLTEMGNKKIFRTVTHYTARGFPRHYRTHGPIDEGILPKTELTNGSTALRINGSLDFVHRP
jgi:hypothetical protein